MLLFTERLEIGRVTCFPSYLKLKLKVGIGLAAETADNWKQLQAKFSNAASQANFSENKGAKGIITLIPLSACQYVHMRHGAYTLWHIRRAFL